MDVYSGIGADLERLEIADALRFRRHPSGLVQGCIATDKCKGVFFLLGAHVSEFQPIGQKPVLFMSSQTFFQEGKPIRGGVPICFPWFGAHPSDPAAPAHGWVRTDLWRLSNAILEDGKLTLRFEYRLDPFDLIYVVQFGDELSLDLQIINGGGKVETCEVALHTYFAVADVNRLLVTGLETFPFLDKLTALSNLNEGNPIRFQKETDRIYHGTVPEISIIDQVLQRRIVLSPRGSHSTVVWNPWIEKSKRMPDFGDDEYQRMCCVETANIAPNQIPLSPGQSTSIGVDISVH